MIHETFRWWLAIEVIGLLALPIALLLFRALPGQGIAFAKPAGLLLTGYLFWLALTAHVLPNRPGSIAWVLILIALADVLILRRSRDEMWAALKQRKGLVIATEVVFTLGLFVAAHIKSYIPEMNGTEKPMDFLYLNAASRSTYYPPEDPWLSGFSVSYYYFGYVIQAMLGKLSAVSTAVAFNLALASTAALAATAAFGLGFEIVSSLKRVAFRSAVIAGVGAVLLVAVIGNLEGVLEFGAANDALPAGVASTADIAGLKSADVSSSCLTPVVCIKYPTETSSYWWWWRATRISPDAGTITEFPFFSFILGDLHPHVMAIPYVLTAFAIGLAFWRSEGLLGLDTWRRAPPLLLLCGVLLGGLGFLNTWDLPTFGLLVIVLALARNLRSAPGARDALREAAGFLLPLGVICVLLYSPFYLTFSSQAGGFEAVTRGATRPSQAILFWGPLMAVALPLPRYLLASDAISRTGSRLWRAASLPVALLLAWAVLILAGGHSLADAVDARGWNWLTALFFAAGLVACILALWRAVERKDEDDGLLAPVLAAMSIALLLIFGAELFYVQDVFNSRLNSVFKLYYQAWLLLGVSGAAGGWWLLDGAHIEMPAPTRMLRGAWTGIAAILLLAALLYPLGAILSRSNGLSAAHRTLDGLAFAGAGTTSSDIRAVGWLSGHADPGERLIEATGSEYSVAGRFSAWTGVPTLLGWRGHETQWGRGDAVLGARAQDIETVYSSTSLADALAILQKYGVTYVVVGSVERATYPAAGLAKFETGLQAVFSIGATTIYRTPPNDGATSGQGNELHR